MSFYPPSNRGGSVEVWNTARRAIGGATTADGSDCDERCLDQIKEDKTSFMSMATQVSSTVENKQKRQSRGRQKIEIKKIGNKSHLQVTFSKRRHGLFNKAAELSLLSGASVAVFVQSSNYKKVYAFSNSSLESIVDCYLFGCVPTEIIPRSFERQCRENNEVNERLEAEKAREKMIRESAAAKEEDGEIGTFWWMKSVDDLDLYELEQYTACIEVLKNNMLNRANELKKESDSEEFDSLLIPNVNFEPPSSLLLTETALDCFHPF